MIKGKETNLPPPQIPPLKPPHPATLHAVQTIIPRIGAILHQTRLHLLGRLLQSARARVPGYGAAGRPAPDGVLYWDRAGCGGGLLAGVQEGIGWVGEESGRCIGVVAEMEGGRRLGEGDGGGGGGVVRLREGGRQG